MSSISRILSHLLLLFALSTFAYGQLTSFTSVMTDPSSCSAADVWYLSTVPLYSNCPNGMMNRFANLEDFDRAWRYLSPNYQTTIGGIEKNISSATAVVMLVGDSHFSGASKFQGAVNTDPVRAVLQASWGNAGAGWISNAGDANNLAPANTSVSFVGGFVAPHWVLTNHTNSGGPDDTDVSNSSTGDTATFVCDYCNDMVLFYKISGGGGTFDCALDGSPKGQCVAGIMTNSTPTVLGTADTGTLLPPGRHTLVVTNDSNTTITIFGVDAIYGQNGVRIEKVSSAGETAAQRHALFINFPTMAASEVVQIHPNIVLIEYMTNDRNAGETPCCGAGTFEGDLENVYGDYTAASAAPNADIVFVSAPDSNVTATYPLSAYVEAMRYAAKKLNAGFIDLFRTFSPYSKVSNLSCYQDTIHLTQQCGEAAGRIITEYLTGSLRSVGFTPISNNASNVIQSSAGIDLRSSPLVEEVANLSVGGTGPNLLAKESSSGSSCCAVTATTSDTNIPVWPVMSGSGTTRNALFCTAGQCWCQFDAASSMGDFVQVSTTIAGKCHDAGATVPTSGWVVGQVIVPDSSATTNYASLVDVSRSFMAGSLGENVVSPCAGMSVTFSNLAASNICILSGTVTSFTLQNPSNGSGQSMDLVFCQPSSGGPYTVSAPTNVRGFFIVGSTPSKCSAQDFVYSPSQSAWLAISPGVTNE